MHLSKHLALCTVWVLTGSVPLRAQSSCSSVSRPLPADGKVIVYSNDAGIRFNRCSKNLTFNFCVIRTGDDTSKISYTYAIKRIGNSKVLRSETRQEDHHKGTFEVTAPSFPIQEEGDYKVAVEVSDANGRTGQFEFPATTAHFGSRTVGLVIGISQYQKEKEGIHRLNYADDDAVQVDKLLQRLQPDAKSRSVVLLQNTTATRDNINGALNSMTKDSDFCEDDLVVFYYSGHGFISEKGIHFLGTYEIDPANVEQSGIQTIQLALELFRISGAQVRPRKLIVIDACYSGFYDRVGEGVPERGKGIVIVDGQVSKGGIALKEDQYDLQGIRYFIQTASSQLLGAAAAEADVPAEECIVLSERDGTGHCWFRDQLTAKELGLPNLQGHGLYTYYFLGNLERQMSTGCYLDLTHDKTIDFKPEGFDSISVLDAHERAVGEIIALSNSLLKIKGRADPLQHPTYLLPQTPKPNTNPFPPIPCSPPTAGNAHQ